MKKICSAFILILGLCIMLQACSSSSQKDDLWDNALYKTNTELGNGTKSIEVDVVTENKTVTFKINTDKQTVGDALLEHKLIEGEKGAYGLYVKVVNGIEADYEKNKSFWSFCKSGESMQTGVDGEKITSGSHYELIYTKQ